MAEMLITLLKSKLHNACVTGAHVDYQGSLGISRELLDAVGLLPYERILVSNLITGERLETYVIAIDEPGQIVLNGAAALKGKAGERIIIMSFAQLTPEEAVLHTPRVAALDGDNRIITVR